MLIKKWIPLTPVRVQFGEEVVASHDIRGLHELVLRDRTSNLEYYKQSGEKDEDEEDEDEEEDEEELEEFEENDN